ncbi:hypothetical protein Dimus_001310 [Dionaea muscipula]
MAEICSFSLKKALTRGLCQTTKFGDVRINQTLGALTRNGTSISIKLHLHQQDNSFISIAIETGIISISDSSPSPNVKLRMRKRTCRIIWAFLIEEQKIMKGADSRSTDLYFHPHIYNGGSSAFHILYYFCYLPFSNRTPFSLYGSLTVLIYDDRVLVLRRFIHPLSAELHLSQVYLFMYVSLLLVVAGFMSELKLVMLILIVIERFRHCAMLQGTQEDRPDPQTNHMLFKCIDLDGNGEVIVLHYWKPDAVIAEEEQDWNVLSVKERSGTRLEQAIYSVKEYFLMLLAGCHSFSSFQAHSHFNSSSKAVK